MPAHDNSLQWYQEVYTFTDRLGRLFTTTNVPYDLQLPSGPVSELQQSTLSKMLRPQYAGLEAPEAAFLVQAVPVADALLSCVSADTVEPERYAGGYRIPAPLQKSWMELESGLSTILGVLLEGFKSNSAALAAVTRHPRWIRPSDCDYRGLHPHYEAAQHVARRTRLSFLLLAARCSMVIAIWEHAPPTPMPAQPTAAQPATIRLPHPTATWIAELERREVPVSWRDAIQESVVSNFSSGLRVGAVFQVGTCGWLDLIPILCASCVPILFRLRSEEDAAFIVSKYPSLSRFIPTPQDRQMAINLSPAQTRPPTYRLIRNGIVRNHPDPTIVPHEIPRGPYQRPEESRQAFITRRKKLSTSLQQREDRPASDRRMDRERRASRELLPHTLSRVYIWTSVGQAYPHYPERWHALEIRVPVPTRAIIGLWRLVSVSDKSYNSFFDEWDLWFSEPDTMKDQALSSALRPVLSPAIVPPTITDPSLLPELDSLPLALDNVSSPTFESEDIRLWYGVRPTHSLFDGVDYDLYLAKVHIVLGRPPGTLPQDPTLLRSLSGWIWAQTMQKLDSSALAETWDLDNRSKDFLVNTASIRRVALRKHVWSKDRNLYEVTFDQDPMDRSWCLLVGAAAVVFLLRHHDVVDSYTAVPTLLRHGIPFHTAIIKRSLSPSSSALSNPQAHYAAPFRRKSFAPTSRDYKEYVQRVLEVLRRPHAAAGWRMGGIIWRLMVEAVGDDEDLRGQLLQQAGQGPSSESSTLRPILKRSDSAILVDDHLSEEELDVISGVYKVYTSQLNQTADVSWWPQHTHWANHAGQYTGIWSQWNEEWFSTRLKGIFDGTASPRTAKQWKNSLGGYEDARDMGQLVELRSEDFIKQNKLLC